jgi:hypothetical protein
MAVDFTTPGDSPREWQVFTPSGFQGRATNTLDALRQARRVLKDEHRWVQGNWFCNSNPDLDPNDAYCNSWAVCAAGAIGIVTIGSHKGKVYDGTRLSPKVGWVFDEDTYEDEAHYLVYEAAVEALRQAAPFMEEYDDEWDPDTDELVGEVLRWSAPYDDVPTFNDDDKTRYQDVIDAFDKAIATEEAKHLTSALT